MARITYTYKYKVYPDCPKATRLSEFWSNPKHGMLIGVPLGIVLIAIAILVYNGNNHELGPIDAICMLFGFVFLFFGSLIVPPLFRLFKISDRVYKKETGRTP